MDACKYVCIYKQVRMYGRNKGRALIIVFVAALVVQVLFTENLI